MDLALGCEADPMTVYAIDPGKHSVYVATVREVLACSYQVCSVREVRDPTDLSPVVDPEVVLEVPEVNRMIPAQDLIDVASLGNDIAGRIAGLTGKITKYTPGQWKGRLPKPIHHSRMWGHLTVTERKLLGGRKTIEAIDAACLRGARARWAKSGERYYRAS